MAGEPTVVFDVGNVLLEWDPRSLYRSVFSDEERTEWFLSHVCTGEWNAEQDRGRSWSDAIAERVDRHPEWRAEIEAYDLRWSEMISGAIEGSVSVLDDLKRLGRPVYAITNFSAEKWAECLGRFAFLNRFDGVVVSAHERLLKPDPAIYRVLFDRYRLEPVDCVFIDDSDRNIATARELGMKGIHFRPGINLRAELRAVGVAI
jgi:2-haloacid dehalogenase